MMLEFIKLITILRLCVRGVKSGSKNILKIDWISLISSYANHNDIRHVLEMV